MIGRTIRVLEQEDPRLAISIFYPSAEGNPLRGLDLYAPCQAEAAAVLREMGVDLRKLNDIDDLTKGFAESARGGAWPVVLWSPGFGVERDMYLGIISSLVPNGYIVVTVSVPNESVFTVYPDATFIKQDKTLTELKSTDYRGWHVLLVSRSRSITSVLDYLEFLNLSDPELAGLFDLGRVAAVGHSLGGATVFEVSKVEKRIKAAILLDPSFHLIHRDGIASSVPILLLRQEASTYDAMASDMNEKIVRDYIDGQRYASTTFSNTYFYRVKGAQHMSFSDVPLHYGDNHAVSVHAVVTEAAAAFLEEVFQNDHVPLAMPLQPSESVIPINSDGEPI